MSVNTKINISKKILNGFFFAVIFYIIFFGIFFRTFGLVHPMSFFCDEGGLIHNLQVKSYWQLFLPLEQAQCSPPFFMILSKFIYSKCGIHEVYLRLLPFISSICSLFLFCFLLNKLFKNRLAVVFSLLTFTFNIKLITYSYIFKHYTTDVLISLLLLIFACYIKDVVPDAKKSVLAAVFCIICMFCSYTACIIVAALFFAYFGKMLCDENLKNKKIQIFKSMLCFCLCFGSAVVVYYFFNCVSNISNVQLQSFWSGHIQNAVFFPHNFSEFKNLIMFLSGMPSFCFLVILVFTGFSVLKLFKTDKYFLIILTMPFVIGLILGILSIYPFAPERVSFYLIPVFIVLLTFFFDISFENRINLYKATNIVFCLLLISVKIFTAFNLNEKNLVEEYSFSNMKQFFEVLAKSDITPDDYIFPNYYNRDLFITYDINHTYDSSKLIAKFDDGDLADFFPDNSYIYFFLSDKYVMYSQTIEKTVRDNCKIVYEVENYYGNFIKCYYKKQK